ncbi:MAG TPA: SMI1/KNR4 family protein [Ramlibacter sp.]|nr:SMI1/KNR4 family protein [Ramlibacter sp.]
MADYFLAASRKDWFRSRPVLENCAVPGEQEVAALEESIGCSLPADMRSWLTIVGFCNIDDDLSFRPEWFRRIEDGQLKGSVLFAQDTLGNFYGYVPAEGAIVFFSRSEPAYAVLAPSFREFLGSLQKRDYKIMDWVESLTLAPYEWNSA